MDKRYQCLGRELSYILFTGILICFINTFLLFAKPGIASCILQQFGVGQGCVVYGALLTKTNRIRRIFRFASLSAARPNFVSPRSQLFITFSIVGVQIFATIIQCIVQNPGMLTQKIWKLALGYLNQLIIFRHKIQLPNQRSSYT